MAIHDRFSYYDGPKDQKSLASSIDHHKNAKRLYEQLYSLYTDPKSAESTEFIQFWKYDCNKKN